MATAIRIMPGTYDELLRLLHERETKAHHRLSFDDIICELLHGPMVDIEDEDDVEDIA